MPGGEQRFKNLHLSFEVTPPVPEPLCDPDREQRADKGTEEANDHLTEFAGGHAERDGREVMLSRCESLVALVVGRNAAHPAWLTVLAALCDELLSARAKKNGRGQYRRHASRFHGWGAAHGFDSSLPLIKY